MTEITEDDDLDNLAVELLTDDTLLPFVDVPNGSVG